MKACITLLSLLAAQAVLAGELLLPITVESSCGTATYTPGKPFPVSLTVSNGLTGPIQILNETTVPNEWNAETMYAQLYWVKRLSDGKLLRPRHPRLDIPANFKGPTSHQIPSHNVFTLQVDASKWDIGTPWIPGKYELLFQITHITVDERCELTILSDPPLQVTVADTKAEQPPAPRTRSPERQREP